MNPDLFSFNLECLLEGLAEYKQENSSNCRNPGSEGKALSKKKCRELLEHFSEPTLWHSENLKLREVT